MLSAGTEATECALKLMRLNGEKIGKKKGGIICFEGNWHGRTLGAQMMGWNKAQKNGSAIMTQISTIFLFLIHG